MKKTRTKRKLIPEPILSEMKTKRDLGVPLRKIIRDFKLAINPTSALALIRAYDAYLTDVDKETNVEQSLFPEWLDGQTTVTSSPDGWSYVGFFPWGYWLNDKNNTAIH
jgi:hypothetical protein